MDDATGLAVAAGLRGYDGRLRVKNLLKKKVRTKNRLISSWGSSSSSL